MIFRKPRKLPHGKEIFRTKNFSLIYLEGGTLHYSYVTKKKLVYGNIELTQNKYKILPLFALAALVSTYLFFISNPSRAALQEPLGNGLVLYNSENPDEEALDAIAKRGDEEYLRETEEKKKGILKIDRETPKFKTYYAHAGETIEEIAARYKVSSALVSKQSNYSETTPLKENQMVFLPEKPGIIYKFKIGDSLASIASLYKVSIDDIIRENDLLNPDIFEVGQKLFLPGAVLPDPSPVWYRPVPSGVITSGYGWRTYPKEQFHEAWDLKAVFEPVYAARSGRVIYSGWMGGYGNVVILEHSSELKTLYAHNSKLYVREGEYIQGGKVISKSGCTGYCFGAHLHFEVIKNGNSIDPKAYIKGFYPK
jgi:LysM repeat protein